MSDRIAIVFARARDERSLEPQQYAHELRHTPGRMTTVVLCCPDCGSSTDLSAQYKINGIGEVEPAFGCRCGFFELVVLDGWGRVA